MMPVAEKWEAGLPVNLKELSEIQSVSYRTVKRWAQDEAFPRVGQLLTRKDFQRWWKKKVQRVDMASRRPLLDDCKSHAQPPTSGSLTALPPRAARLRDAIESRRKP